MLAWSEFAVRAPALARAGGRLLGEDGLAMLATADAAGRPRIHPFVVKIVDGALAAFILDASPKRRDLDERGLFAIHALPGAEDEEFLVSGRALPRDADADFRARVDRAMGYFTGSADAHHVLYEFRVDEALWTTWVDFGTPAHRPRRRRWRLAAKD